MQIYKMINLVNGKIYIGADSKNRLEYLGSGLLLNRALSKYGRSNFTKEILAWCDTKDQLNFLEKFYIQFFNSKSPNGYNLTDGGDGLVNPSKEVREKISKSCMGRIRPLDERLRISLALRGVKKLPMAPIHKLHVSIAKKGQLQGSDNPAKRPEVRAKLKGHPSYHTTEGDKKISQALTGKPSKTKGRHWKQSEEAKQRRKGKQSNVKGKRWSDKSREKLSKSMKGKRWSEARWTKRAKMNA